MATFYIDPTYTGSVSDGSIETPYKSWDDFGLFESNNNYLQKRGTEITSIEKRIIIGGDGYQGGQDGPQVSNILLGAYGEGVRPIINGRQQSRDTVIAMTICDNIRVEGLDLRGSINYNNSDETTVAIFGPGGYWQTGFYGCTNTLIKDCKLSGAYNGVRALAYSTSVDGIKVENCEIFNCTEDGAFIKDSNNVEFSGCHIHSVNQSYLNGTENAGGDGIQCLNATNIYVHDCTIDRSDTANKFCIIQGHTDGLNPNDAIRIEDNTLISPQSQGGGAIIYLFGGEKSIIKGNNFETKAEDGGLLGIWSHTPSIKVHYNVFNKNPQGITLFDTAGFDKAEIYNNTFNMVGPGPVYSGDGVIISTGSGYIAKNNIFKTATGVAPFWGNGDEFSNNCFSETNENVGTTDIISDPMFVDELNNNFKLKENSPCINTGTDLGFVFDKNGTPIVGIPDMGAYEYDGVAVIPSCPSKISPLNNATTNTTVTLKWVSVWNADGYKLIFNGIEQDLGKVTEFFITGLTFETNYTWAIVPYNVVGDAANCPTWNFTTKIENVLVDYIDLKWILIDDANGYKISLGSDNPPTNVENGLDLGNVDTYKFENPETSTTYFWQIIPYNEGGEAIGCPIWSFTTEDDGTILPPSPTIPEHPSDGATNVPIIKA